jgi:hypothetical protein
MSVVEARDLHASMNHVVSFHLVEVRETYA